MSSFFIKVEDGAPIGNPMPLSAAQSIGFFEHGYQNGEIPEDLENFRPLRVPFTDFNQVLETDGKFHKVDGVWQRVYEVRSKTAKELEAFKKTVLADWAKGLAYPSWSYDEKVGQMVPPVQPADNIKNVVWDEKAQSWSGDPLGPEDAKIV